MRVLASSLNECRSLSAWLQPCMVGHGGSGGVAARASLGNGSERGGGGGGGSTSTAETVGSGDKSVPMGLYYLCANPAKQRRPLSAR